MACSSSRVGPPTRSPSAYSPQPPTADCCRGDPPDWERYARLRASVHARFDVPATTITPLMARVLYGVGCWAHPARVLGIGTYVGNAFAWLAAAGFGPERVYDGDVALAVDPDAEAIAQSRTNMDQRAGWSVEHAVVDGHLAPSMLGGNWDALWLDADDPVERKGILVPLLERAYPFLAPRALVLAHDVVVDRFRDHMCAYREHVADPVRFAASATFPIDPCGLEISVRAGVAVAARNARQRPAEAVA